MSDTKALSIAPKTIDQTSAMLQAAGLDASMANELQGAEVIQSGGVTKWVDLKAFQANPDVGDKDPVAGNGKAFAGALLGCQEIEDDNGEPNNEGVKVRRYYLLRLLSQCPVSYQDENKETVEEVAQPGEIVAIGERAKLAPLRALCEDGGLYALIIKPHSRIKIRGGRTMWTFDVVKKTVRPPVKMTVVSEKPGF